MKKWITAMNTYCGGHEPCCHTTIDGEEFRHVTLFKSKAHADASVADSIIMQLDEVVAHCRSIEECDFETEYSEEVEVDEGGFFEFAGKRYHGVGDD